MFDGAATNRRAPSWVATFGGFQQIAFNYVADKPGPTEFDCHHQGASFVVGAFRRF